MKHGHSACWRSKEHPDNADLNKLGVLCYRMVKDAGLRCLKDTRCISNMGCVVKVGAAVMAELLERH